MCHSSSGLTCDSADQVLLKEQAWHQTLEYLTTKGHYQVLCFDNRGVGHSEHSNDGRFYKTSQMAADVDELLHFVGWTEKRSLNVVGISMGGMISLELVSYPPYG